MQPARIVGGVFEGPSGASPARPAPARFLVERSIGALAVMAVALALGARVTQAESGRVDQMVGGNLRVTFDSLGVPALGYRPIRVRITPLAPVTSPRVLELQAVVKCSAAKPIEQVVSQQVDLPPGATQVEAILSLPPGTAGDCFLEVLEDGRPIPGLAPRAPVPLDVEIDAVGVFPRVLAVTAAPPDFGQLAEALRAGVDTDQATAPWQLGTAPVGSRTFAWRPRSQLPRRWIDLSGADLVCIALDDLAALRAEDSEAFRALLEWTASGGNLVVSGVGRQQQRLHVLESLLGLKPPLEGKASGAGWREPAPGTRDAPLPAARLFPETTFEADVPGSAPVPGDPPDLESGPLAEAPPGTARPKSRVRPGSPGVRKKASPDLAAKRGPRKPDGGEGRFWLCPYSWGMVVAVGSEAIWPGTAIGWRWMLNALGSDRWLWDRRHGVSVIHDNPEFWNFLIPGVGLAPVAGFEVLITLFVLAVGPVNYLLLRRAKRLHWMVVTVPGSAVLATGLLLVFALLSEGLGTRVRARSITWIDQRQGQAVCWARLSYYAGVAPRGGLRFATDTMVIPYFAEPRIISDMLSRRLALAWTGQDQWFRSGWIASRTPTQFVTLRTRPTTLGLEVVPSAGGTWEVRNRLGTHIHRLVLRDWQGRYFQAAEIQPGGSRLLEPMAGAVRLEEFRPPSLGPPTSELSAWSLRRRWRYGYRWPPVADDLWWSESESRTSRAESRLASPVTQSPLGGLEPKPAGLEPGSYVAVVERSPEVEFGTAAAREVASFHLVLGTYGGAPGAGPVTGAGSGQPLRRPPPA